jgi:hypothetical protein
MNAVLTWFKHRKIEILIFVMLFLAGASFHHLIEYDNTASRYFLLGAIVDYQTLNIDAFQKGTIDKSKRDNHYYSSKAPGAALLGVPVYWCLRHLTPLRYSTPLEQLQLYIVRVMTTTLLFALLGVVLYRLARFYGASSRHAFLMVIAYGFGSIALLHATLFSGHQIAASFSFFSFAMLVHLSGNNKNNGQGHWYFGFLAGLFAGFAVITDYTAVIIVIGLAMYAITSRMGVGQKVGFMSGGCVWILVLAAYNMACFGHPFSFSYEHQVYEHFKEGTAHGILGIGLPRPEAIMGLLFSPSRGLFFIMPVFLLSLWGIARMFTDKQHLRESVLIIAIITGSFLFVAGFYGWHGGLTFGPRYLVPMLPFLVFPIAFLRWKSYLFWLLFILSFIQVGFSVAGVPHVPKLIANPIVEFIVPLMSYGYTSLNTGILFGLAWPWAVVAAVIILGVIGVWAFRESYREELLPDEDRIPALVITIGVVWIVFIVTTLAVVRTDSTTTVKRMRSSAIADWINNAHLWKQYGDQQVIEYLSKAVKQQPNNAEIYQQRGIAYANMGEQFQAIENFNSAIRLKPDYVYAISGRGSVYLNQNNKELGCRDAQKACSLGNCILLEGAKSEGLCP